MTDRKTKKAIAEAKGVRKAKTKAKAEAKKAKLRVHKVKLNKGTAIHIIPVKDVHPAIVHSEGRIEVVPVPRERPMGWWEFLFGRD